MSAQEKFTFLSGEACPTGGRYFGSALRGNMQGVRAGVSRGHSRCGSHHEETKVAGNELGE